MAEASSEKGIWVKLQEIDRRVIYLLMWIVVLWPLLNPINLPVGLGRQSKEYFDVIDAIPPGSKVVFSYDLSFSGIPELGPMSVATFHQLLSKDVKVYICAYWNAGADIASDDIELLNPEERYGKVYGLDYIHMGFNPMREVGMSQFAADVYKAFPTDFINNRALDTYEIMEGINSAEDFDVLISIESGTPGCAEWVRQWIEPYDIPFLVGALGVSTPGIAPYYNAGQVKAFIAGLRGAAEYEMLVGRAADAMAQQDPLSTTHILVVFFVILGNIGYFYTRGKSQRS
ncbi:MAG: hypothetical protein ACETVY_00225 [Candidatus Bathyarchaeia archaeon]